MTPEVETVVAALRGRASGAGVILDFDGTLAHIVERPELAVLIEGVAEALGTIVKRYKLTAIVSGRRSGEIAALIPVDGLELVGLYGAEDLPPVEPAIRRAATSAIAEVPEAWLEDKGSFLAVHFRRSPNPTEAEDRLRRILMPIAASGGLELLKGKRVIELAPRSRGGKGAAVIRLARSHQLEAAFFAGDDVADLDAFVALDELAADGLLVTKVAVGGPETPHALLRAADLTVVGPAGLLALLRLL